MKNKILIALFLVHIQIYSALDIAFFNYKKEAIWAFDESLLNFLNSTFHIDTFIESGTYAGDTTEKASRIFNQVYSIELSHNYYSKALSRFKNYKNISLYCGDSPEVLSSLLPLVKAKICFFLDGHFSGGTTACSINGSTPILAELKAIKESNINDAVIMIDDIRLFQKTLSNNSSANGYPTLKEVYGAIKEINPLYDFIVFGDVSIAFLHNLKHKVSPFLRAYTSIRLIQESVILSEKELSLFDDLKEISHKEFLNFQEFSKVYSGMGIQSAYFDLINGFFALHKNKLAEAKTLFKQASHFIPYVSKLNIF